MVKNDSNGNDRFHGFNVDVIRALSAMLNFRYELYVVGDEHSRTKGTTVSDMIVRELVEGVSISVLTLSVPIPLKRYTLPYWSNLPFLIFDIQALWRSGLSARAPECQKLKMMG